MSIKITIVITLVTATVIAGVTYVSVRQSESTSEIVIQSALQYSLNITPSSNLDKALISCLEDPNALAVKITSPKADEVFASNKKVSFAAQYEFKCYPLGEKDIKYSWRLNEEEVSQKKSDTLPILGSRAYILSVEARHKSYIARNEVSFNINPNTLPVVNITSPKAGAPIAALYFYWRDPKNPKCGIEVDCSLINLSGSASDKEDGNLSGSKLIWYVLENGVWKQIATGASASVWLPAYCSSSNPYKVKLEATDSQGGRSNKQVDISTISNNC